MDAGVADTTVLLLLFNTTRTLSGPPSTHVASRSTQRARARAHDPMARPPDPQAGGAAIAWTEAWPAQPARHVFALIHTPG